jgi:energy-converting hydrogenase A subunit M
MKENQDVENQDNVELSLDQSNAEKQGQKKQDREFEYGFNDPKAEGEENDELLKLMKKRIIRSYRWHEDVVVPLSSELKISVEEFENILMKKLDMSSLEALHGRFESAKPRCIKERIHADLRLCWLVDVMNILTEEEAEDIKNKITNEILKKGKSYDEALKNGREELLELLR